MLQGSEGDIKNWWQSPLFLKSPSGPGENEHIGIWYMIASIAFAIIQ